jgi:Fe-S-cluster containining protein
MSEALSTPTGAQWGCHRCGACCRVFQLGPVEPEILQNLAASGVEDWWPPAAEAPFFHLRPTPEGPQAFLRKVDGACVFLDPEQGCVIHARLGAAAKPSFCRQYPFHVVRDPLGLSAAVRSDCGGLGQDAAGDAPVSVLAAAHLDLPRPEPIPALLAPEYPLVPGLAVPAEGLARFVREQEAALAAQDAAPAVLFAETRAAAARSFGLRFPASDPARAEAALQRVARALRDLVVQVDAAGEAPSPAEAALVADVAQTLTAACAAPGPAAFTPAAAASANLSLRGHLLTHQGLAQGSVGAGLGLLDLQIELCARASAPEPVDRPALTGRLSRLLRLCAHPALAQLLRAHRPLVLERFVYAP